MASRRAALLAAIALAGGLSACGADEELSSDIPRTSPDLTIPTATTELPPADTDDDDDDDRDLDDAAGRRGAAACRTAARRRHAAPAARGLDDRRRRRRHGRGTPTTGGATPSDPDFQNFCRDNPGAPPPC